MEKKKFHSIRLEKLPESNHELGKVVSHLRYDQIVDFFAGFMEGIREQEKADRQIGRTRLADSLSVASTQAENQGLHFAVIADNFHDQLAHEYWVFPKSNISVDWARKMTE